MTDRIAASRRTAGGCTVAMARSLAFSALRTGAVGSLIVSIAAALVLVSADATSAEPVGGVTVSSTSELIEALRSDGSARTIRLRAGRYVLDTTLTVPDGVELTGDGVMQLDSEGVPVGFAAGTATVLVAGEHLRGDVVVLGDRTRLQGLRVEGGARNDDTARGNIVLIASRRPDDRVHATLLECEIFNHGPAGVGPIGPTGRTIAVVTLNPGGGAASHERARVSVTIERSVVRSTTSNASVFVINFASSVAIALDFEHNRFEGVVALAGGVGRPDIVSGSRVELRSRANLYVDRTGTYPVGWYFLGASIAPHEHIHSQGASYSSFRVESEDDRIEGYRTAIIAAAARLVDDLPGSLIGNRGELLLSRLRVRTVGDGAVDLWLQGLLHERDSNVGPGPEASSRAEDNVLRVSVKDSSGSGARANRYVDSALSGAADIANRNRLEFTGTRAEFLESNARFDPAPGADRFLAPTGSDQPAVILLRAGPESF